VEEVATSGGTTTRTAYYYAGAKRIGLSVNGTISYLAGDGLGSPSVTLSSGGGVSAAVLYAPYGAVRYSSGTMPTSYGFTGQRTDAASGLDYYGARYYDPQAGQFASGDSVVPGDGYDLWGLSRYAYVESNPTNRTDPSGHRNVIPGDNGGLCDITDPSCGGGSTDSGGGSGAARGPCWMTGGVCLGGRNGGSAGSGGHHGGGNGSHTGGGAGGDNRLKGLSDLKDRGLTFLGQFWANFTNVPPEAQACEPDGPCYSNDSPGYNECVSSGRCTEAMLCSQGGQCDIVPLIGGVGGKASVDKGSAGVKQVADSLTARGYTVVGSEVSFETNGGTVKADLVALDANGNIVVVEVKTGPTARLNRNQVSAYRALRTNGGIPQGEKAAQAGLRVGEAIGPVEVVEVAVLP
jgi:RHS repeat-associated protein